MYSLDFFWAIHSASEKIWLVKHVMVDPMLVGIGEFTTHFGTCLSGWIGMFTECDVDFDPWP